ncbi:GNAT family N-acetyltransferase [Piscinibacter sp.]|uniref:GNAT family N-acetyltransferase n=1 Tax=Piscinibacter sp. TaxID=1903157 RepID=UPI002C1134CC|nr:GNAT family N-acetyltransferase [Albitalea sp.]HUG23378.1 GNAT family N-acetyltransferase [Albitalea sp.]
MTATTFPTLETERLLLREIVASDAPVLFAIHGDCDSMRWFGTDPLDDLQQAEQLVETFAAWRRMPNPGTRWGIQTKADSRLVGTCGLFKWNRGWKSCIVGYELARPAAIFAAPPRVRRTCFMRGTCALGHARRIVHSARTMCARVVAISASPGFQRLGEKTIPCCITFPSA